MSLASPDPRRLSLARKAVSQDGLATRASGERAGNMSPRTGSFCRVHPCRTFPLVRSSRRLSLVQNTLHHHPVTSRAQTRADKIGRIVAVFQHPNISGISELTGKDAFASAERTAGLRAHQTQALTFPEDAFRPLPRHVRVMVGVELCYEVSS